MSHSTIYHITSAAIWEEARHAGRYEADTLATEGFIHCSTAAQVPRVAGALFAGQDGLVVLAIDPERLGSPIRYENLEGGEEPFPHIYGPIPSAAVVRASGLAWGPRGECMWTDTEPA